MSKPIHLPRSLGSLTLAMTLSLTPLGAWPDHGSHEHDFVKDLIGGHAQDAGPARKTQARSSPPTLTKPAGTPP